MTKVEVSVIIVNYNTCRMTAECINSVFERTKCNTFEVILIDNASTDGSKEYFEKDLRISYIYLSENIGFGRANNVGIKSAVGNFLFLLNSDTLLIGDVIQDMVEFVNEHVELRLGALGTCLVDSLGQDILSFGQFLSPSRIYYRLCEKTGLCRSYETNTYHKLADRKYVNVDHISGADLFIPTNVIKELGDFDSTFFMYYEETDLEKRMDDAGYVRIVLNVRKIIHFEGGSFVAKKQNFLRNSLIVKSMMLYIQKHFHGIAKFHISILMFLITLKDIVLLDYTFKQKVTILQQIFKR